MASSKTRSETAPAVSPAAVSLEQAWRRTLGYKMIRKGYHPAGYYGLTVNPEYYLKYIQGDEVSPDHAIIIDEEKSKLVSAGASVDGDEVDYTVPHISPTLYYGLRIKAEYYEKFLKGQEVSDGVTIEFEMPVESRRM